MAVPVVIVLTKELLRVSRAGGGYHPQFVGDDHRELAARVIGIYQGHVGQRREQLESALTDLERDAPDFKLVRGFAKLLEREATFETRAPLPPERARRVAFEAAERVGVVTESDRERALAVAADRLAVEPDDLDESLYADLEDRQVLTDVSARYDPESLCRQYDLSLAQTALFDATEVRIESDDPKAVISAVKRLRLMYEIERTGDGRAVVVTGPTALFRRTRRYGTRFARLLRSVAKTAEWRLVATIDDDGTDRRLVLTGADVTVPDHEPVTAVTFDSGVEADFATRFEALDLDWDLVREPEPLAAGAHVVIPDFAFDYRYADFRVYFEIMGFWTPEYVAKKLDRLADLEDVELLVAVDRSLGVGEIEDIDQLTESGDASAEIEARDHRAITYSGTVRLKNVRDALRRYEDELVAESVAELPEKLVPEEDVTTLAAVAEEHGVSEDAIEARSLPEHERLGRTLVRPGVLDSLAGEIEAGMDLGDVESVLETHGIDDASAILSRLGYRVEWDGLSGGTVRER
ncbi:Nuclease of restriction endonuclease-like fold, implicated in nucleotide excision repair [Halapricum desulfuricans]|uniref:Nuclease of restriction endonuclease-like fold, implicated in nucleotide excision repair n=1 Tax=Halapricum desulfuricans TaxID=2841257 RepID=A0A897NGZ0_9EURY|nr:Nuclease of restriction endonuclease-like fold, implicated in nucleotide excision repair [Halapricum desulfuricans]